MTEIVDQDLDEATHEEDQSADNSKRKISDKHKLIIGFIVTLFFSVLGFIFSYYASLSKPRIDIVEIGLSGSKSGRNIEVDSLTITNSERTVGIPSLSRFESFEKLLFIEKSASEEIAKIDDALLSIEDWYKKYTTINNSNLEDHPLRNQLVNQYFISAIRTQFTDVEKIFPTEVFDKLVLKEPKVPLLVGRDDGYQVLIISFGVSVWRLQFRPQLEQEFITRGITGLAYSVATHDFNLLKKATDETRRWLENQKNRLTMVRNGARKLILPNSTFSASIVASNTGGSAFVVSPYMVMDIINSDLDQGGILLGPTTSSSEKNPFKLTEGGFSIDIDPSDADGAEVLVEDFLPNGKSSAYTIVSPGSSQQINLVGVESLGIDASKFLSLLESESLSVIVSAKSVEGKIISSTEFAFRSNIRESTVREIISGFSSN